MWGEYKGKGLDLHLGKKRSLGSLRKENSHLSRSHHGGWAGAQRQHSDSLAQLKLSPGSCSCRTAHSVSLQVGKKLFPGGTQCQAALGEHESAVCSMSSHAVQLQLCGEKCLETLLNGTQHPCPRAPTAGIAVKIKWKKTKKLKPRHFTNSCLETIAFQPLHSLERNMMSVSETRWKLISAAWLRREIILCTKKQRSVGAGPDLSAWPGLGEAVVGRRPERPGAGLGKVLSPREKLGRLIEAGEE